MDTTRWAQLSPRARTMLVGVGLADAALRLVALKDLKGRDAADVRGPKRAWGLGLALVSSSGVLPTAYLLWGRRR
ncbi:hypothetical protein [Nocardioides sp. GY 10127]|uniref:hypothetical protein n=1 Tax=Nocardioides sp. GY 10127 TaxID=2569762 RepID=UPI0010A798B7|nr:hypothetical protein [Nocardioides sp. GY 10127]TIC79128.1 hypothetical protein E8D37_18385 [Nocardioides sp. GY 10127]